MPAPTQTIKPRWPAVPYPMNNGTIQAPKTTTTPPNLPEAIGQTPSVIPSPVYQSVSVVPAESIPTSPPHAEIPRYAGSAALLQGYCTEPAYTIIDGPTAVWIPVVGCISSKADCCPTPTAGGAAGILTSGGVTVTPSGGPGPVDGGGGAQFPVSLLPSQGTLTGCPKDYHTVGGTACCPSSYWLWSTTLGGQVPCYSSLPAKLTPPPIPDTLVNGGDQTITGSGSRSRTASTHVPALTMSQKPTLAIVNIAYSMQYPMVPAPKPALEKKAKIGIGVGAGSAGVLIAVMLWFLIRKVFAHRKTKQDLNQTSVSQRFGTGVDMSRVAHQPAVIARTHGGKTYTGVSSRHVDF